MQIMGKQILVDFSGVIARAHRYWEVREIVSAPLCLPALTVYVLMYDGIPLAKISKDQAEQFLALLEKPEKTEGKFKDPRHFKKWDVYRDRETGALVHAVQWYRNDILNIEGFQQVEVDAPNHVGSCAVAFVPGIFVPIVSGEFIIKHIEKDITYGRLEAVVFHEKYAEDTE